MRGTPLLLVSLFSLLQDGEFFLEKVGGTRVAEWEEWPDQLGSGRGKLWGDRLAWVGDPEIWGLCYLLPCCQVTVGDKCLQDVWRERGHHDTTFPYMGSIFALWERVSQISHIWQALA